jgi:hypothetical protein
VNSRGATCRVGVRSKDRNAWEWEELNSHVAGLWIAVHNAENGIGAVVMRVALDRGAR